MLQWMLQWVVPWLVLAVLLGGAARALAIVWDEWRRPYVTRCCYCGERGTPTNSLYEWWGDVAHNRCIAAALREAR